MSPLTLPFPYAEASPAQRQQALFSARQVLDAAYPHLSRTQWVAALDLVQPPLLTTADQPGQLTHDGLVALALHLATMAGDTAVPAPPAGRESTPTIPSSRPVATRKQTYVIPDDLREQLANVSYWRRIPVNQLVLASLRQLLDQYPEAQRPRPDPTAPPPEA